MVEPSRQFPYAFVTVVTNFKRVTELPLGELLRAAWFREVRLPIGRGIGAQICSPVTRMRATVYLW